MVWVPRTYPRAAGIQSEIGRGAITRVALREIECQRRLRVEATTAKYSIREIEHTQQKLRQTMSGYSSTLKKNKRDRRLRYYESKKRRGETSEVCPQPDVQQELEPIRETLSPSSVSCQVDSDDGHIEVKKHIRDVGDVFETASSYGDCEIYQDEANVHKQDAEVDHCDGLDALPTSDIDRRTSLALNVTVPVSRKRAVKKKLSQMDLIKLQYSNNVKKLFSAVHTLAEVHGIELPDEPVSQIEDPRQNAQLQQTRLNETAILSGQSLSSKIALPSSYLFKQGHGLNQPVVYPDQDIWRINSDVSASTEIRHSTATRRKKISESSSGSDSQYHAWKQGLAPDAEDCLRPGQFVREITDIPFPDDREKHTTNFTNTDPLLVPLSVDKPTTPHSDNEVSLTLVSMKSSRPCNDDVSVDNHTSTMTRALPLLGDLTNRASHWPTTSNHIRYFRDNRQMKIKHDSIVTVHPSNTTLPKRNRFPSIPSVAFQSRQATRDRGLVDAFLPNIPRVDSGTSCPKVTWQTAMSRLKVLHHLK